MHTVLHTECDDQTSWYVLNAYHFNKRLSIAQSPIGQQLTRFIFETNFNGQGACHKDLYYPMIDENTAELRDTDAEFRRLKADFLRIARNRRRRGLSQSESSRSPSPARHQP